MRLPGLVCQNRRVSSVNNVGRCRDRLIRGTFLIPLHHKLDSTRNWPGKPSPDFLLTAFRAIAGGDGRGLAFGIMRFYLRSFIQRVELQWNFFQNLSQLQQRFNRRLLKRRNASSRVSSFSAFIAERLAVCFCDGSVEFFSPPLRYHI